MPPPPNTKPPKDFQRPGVLFQPAASRSMQRGINKILKAIRPTLGPYPRYVAIEPIANRNNIPERLDSGGTIARRIIQIQNRDEDVGAMFIRNVLFSMQEKVGDGTATAAVLFQSIFNDSLYYLVNGGNAMRLRTFLDEAVKLILDELDLQIIRLRGKKQLAGLAATITNDPDIATYLGEIFDIIGEYGRLEIRNGRSREIEREYVEGIYWDSSIFSREMIYDKTENKTTFEDTHILISDLDIQEPRDLLPLMDLCVANGIKDLLLVCAGISDRALGLLFLKPNLEKLKIAAVKSPEIAMTSRIGSLSDLAILTGGHVFASSANETLANVKLEDLGQARRAWANQDNFGIIGGKGDPRRLREHIASLRAGYANLKDSEERKKILDRLGKLMGGSATLWIGDTTPNTIQSRKDLAIRAAEAMRGAMREGVVPGGGVALLNCRGVLRQAMQGVTDLDQLAAYRIIAKALEQPFRVLVENGGGDLDEVVPAVKAAGPGFGYDVVRKEVVDMAKANIYDVAPVVKAAVYSAINGAALAMTTDVVIHRKNPPESLATTS